MNIEEQIQVNYQQGKTKNCHCFVLSFQSSHKIPEMCVKPNPSETRHPWLKMVPLHTSPGLFLDTILRTLSAYVVCVLKVLLKMFLTKSIPCKDVGVRPVYTMCAWDHKNRVSVHFNVGWLT